MGNKLTCLSNRSRSVTCSELLQLTNTRLSTEDSFCVKAPRRWHWYSLLKTRPEWHGTIWGRLRCFLTLWGSERWECGSLCRLWPEGCLRKLCVCVRTRMLVFYMKAGQFFQSSTPPSHVFEKAACVCASVCVHTHMLVFYIKAGQLFHSSTPPSQVCFHSFYLAVLCA